MLQLLSVKNDLIFIKTNIYQIVTTIKSSEKSNTPLVEMINLIENTFTQLEQILGEKWKIVKTKILQLQKKPRIQSFEKCWTNNENNRVQLPENYSSAMVANLQYSPVTSVDVERSFSIYKNIITNRRTKMTPEHN